VGMKAIECYVIAIVSSTSTINLQNVKLGQYGGFTQARG